MLCFLRTIIHIVVLAQVFIGVVKHTLLTVCTCPLFISKWKCEMDLIQISGQDGSVDSCLSALLMPNLDQQQNVFLTGPWDVRIFG